MAKRLGHSLKVRKKLCPFYRGLSVGCFADFESKSFSFNDLFLSALLNCIKIWFMRDERTLFAPFKISFKPEISSYQE